MEKVHHTVPAQRDYCDRSDWRNFWGHWFSFGWQGGFHQFGDLGLLLGLIGGFSSGLAMLVSAKYWGDYAGRYAAWWIKNETEGEQEQSKGSEKEARKSLP
ncbi:MAG: hypothetical protein AAB217_06990 [Chloroflexota bacterium]